MCVLRAAFPGLVLFQLPFWVQFGFRLVLWFGVFGCIHGCVLLLLCHLRICFAKSSFGFALGNFVPALAFRKQCRLFHLRVVLDLVVVR